MLASVALLTCVDERTAHAEEETTSRRPTAWTTARPSATRTTASSRHGRMPSRRRRTVTLAKDGTFRTLAAAGRQHRPQRGIAARHDPPARRRAVPGRRASCVRGLAVVVRRRTDVLVLTEEGHVRRPRPPPASLPLRAQPSPRIGRAPTSPCAQATASSGIRARGWSARDSGIGSTIEIAGMREPFRYSVGPEAVAHFGTCCRSSYCHVHGPLRPLLRRPEPRHRGRKPRLHVLLRSAVAPSSPEADGFTNRQLLETRPQKLKRVQIVGVVEGGGLSRRRAPEDVYRGRRIGVYGWGIIAPGAKNVAALDALLRQGKTALRNAEPPRTR